MASVQILRALACSLVVAMAWGSSAVAATERQGEEVVLRCQIEGRDRQASVSLTEAGATYRYGPSQGVAELTLSSSLTDLDYVRNSGPAGTVDEIVTFANGDTAYRFETGFRSGVQPDPSALIPFGNLVVSRGGRELARLPCDSASIERTPDRLLARMRDIGRERASDGTTFPNYDIHPRIAAADAAPCEAQNNVDTCWSRGVSAARGGDLRAALEHYDMSCAARIMVAGCYEAGKLYLQNRQLRDYARARAALSVTCDSDDAGQGPYACKYLGWMSLTGTGVERDLDRAIDKLAQACFLHNDAILIDGEGCHFLGRALLERSGGTARTAGEASYLAYLSYAQGCTDDAETICEEARDLLRQGQARSASWVVRCNEDTHQYEAGSCAELIATPTDYDVRQGARRQLRSLFRQASSPSSER